MSSRTSIIPAGPAPHSCEFLVERVSFAAAVAAAVAGIAVTGASINHLGDTASMCAAAWKG